MSRRAESLAKLLKALARDESGVILPYVTVMMIAIMGLATLALDAARYTSLQTQVQAGADALALAGARELDGSKGSIDRAKLAIASMVDNTLNGMGSTPRISSATITFYSSLNSAENPERGISTTVDADAQYVGVVTTPASTPTILPNPIGLAQLSTTAEAVAGYDFAICNMPPVFICNPYETAGMTNADATSALLTNLKDPAVHRQQTRLSIDHNSGYGPGHFGFLVPPDQCKGGLNAKGANCLTSWITTARPPACYRKKTVDLNTGQMQSVLDAFNVRFDIYKGSLTLADGPPATNVRKGYLPGTGANRWCPPKGSPAAPYYTTPIPTGVTGTLTATGNGRTVISNVNSVANVAVGSTITAANNGIPAGTTITAVGATAPYTITLSAGATTAGNTALTIMPRTSGLPLDAKLWNDPTQFFGDGDWNCADYWTINHTTAAPTGCTSSNPTVSRYDVYRYEIANGLIKDWSGNRLQNASSGDPGTGESGGTYCAGDGTGVDNVDNDRRVIYAAVINCLQPDIAAKMNSGGATATDIKVAGFAKLFMTQPVGISDPKVDPNSIYGEMTGAVGLDKNAKNNVQLYR